MVLLVKLNSSFWAVVHFQDANDLLVGINLKKYSSSVPKIWYLINREFARSLANEIQGRIGWGEGFEKIPQNSKALPASYKPIQLLEAVLTRKGEPWTI